MELIEIFILVWKNADLRMDFINGMNCFMDMKRNNLNITTNNLEARTSGTVQISFADFDSKWLAWFVGFTDAEGSFTVYPKKRTLASGEISKYNVGLSFHISLHNKDIDIVKDIRNKLNNVGTLYEYSDRDEARIAINDKKGLESIFPLLELFPLITTHQLSRYLILNEFLTNDIKEFKTLEEYTKTKDEISLKILENLNKVTLDSILSRENIDNWIVGFVNGEGCFYLKKDKLNFCLEHTDKFALDLIKQRFSFGPNVLERSPRARDKNKPEIKKTYLLHISSKKDINNLIEFFDSDNTIKLQGNKLIQYNDWKKNLM